MLTPLAGTISFYSKNEELIKEIDMDEYDEMANEEFMRIIQKVEAHKVTLHACYHNYDVGKKSVLYEKED